MFAASAPLRTLVRPSTRLSTRHARCARHNMLHKLCSSLLICRAPAGARRPSYPFDMTGPIETEIKIPMKEGAGPARLLIEEHGYRMIAPRTLQVDQVFDTADRALQQSGRLLRLRSERTPMENDRAIL